MPYRVSIVLQGSICEKVSLLLGCGRDKRVPPEWDASRPLARPAYLFCSMPYSCEALQDVEKP